MSKKIEFLYLQQEDCIKAGGTDMKECIKAVERSFFLHGKKDFIQPGKPVIRWGGPETEETIGRIMSMPSFLGGEKYSEELKKRNLLGPVNTSGIKFIPSRPSNPSKYGLPRSNAIIIILNSETLMPECIMDGKLVSDMRTGAASGVACKYLARKDAEVMGLIGTGVQGRTQLMAFRETIPNLKLCKVFDINPKKAKIFVEEMSEVLDIKIIRVASAEEAFKESDVVSTATMAQKPYVKGKWYKEGILHTEISFWDTPPEALKEIDAIIVDDWYQVKHHGVDVSWRAVHDGFITEEKVRADLGKVIVGEREGRINDKERIFFNPIGMGIHDLSEAYRIFQNARNMGIGKMIPLWDSPIWA